MADPEETGVPQTPDAQRALLEQLFKPEAGGKLGQADLRAAMTKLFGDKAREAATPQVVATVELAPDVEARLRASFDKNMAVWDSLGVFTPEREARGHSKPTFEEYKAGFARNQEFTKSGRPNELGKGYDTVNFVPMDVPLVSEDPEEQTMFSMLEKTLKEEFARGGQGQDKPANSLVIKTRRGQRMVRTEQQVDLNEILWAWKEGYLKQQVVHRPTALAKKGHGGFSESELLAHGTDVERKNGGFMRLQRSAIILPQDIGKETMSGQDWVGEKGKSIPKGVELQTAHDGIAFMIQFIKEHHYIPDAWTGTEATSQVALMPETFFPDEGSSGAVAAANFVVKVRLFCLGRRSAVDRVSFRGVRGGVRINEA